MSLANKTPTMSVPPARIAGIKKVLTKGETTMNTIDFNKLRASIPTGGDLVDELRKVQQSRYDREDKSLLDALNQANAYLSTQYNLDEGVK